MPKISTISPPLVLLVTVPVTISPVLFSSTIFSQARAVLALLRLKFRLPSLSSLSTTITSILSPTLMPPGISLNSLREIRPSLLKPMFTTASVLVSDSIVASIISPSLICLKVLSYTTSYFSFSALE